MVKYILYPMMLALALSLATPGLCAAKKDGGDIRAIRAGRHKGFHRLVIALRRKAAYRMKKTKRALEIDILNVDSRSLRGGFAGTEFFRVKKISTALKEGAPLTTIDITLLGPAVIRDRLVADPYKIIVDMYPVKKPKPHVKKKRPVVKRVKKKTAVLKTTPAKILRNKVRDKKYSKKSYHGSGHKRAFAFNEGWRWIFRKEAVRRLKKSFYGNIADNGLEILLEYVPIKGGTAWDDGAEARAYVKALAKHGYKARAATLKTIIALIKKEADLLVAERAIEKEPYNNYTPIAHFLLASAYEREGFYPEAVAYYGMAYDAKASKKLKAHAAIGRGRALFFSGHPAKSLKWFERAGKEGSEEADGWLAGSLLLKGEFRAAWARYRRLGPTKDPLSLMGLGDMKMMRGDYKGAHLIFKGLKSRFMEEPFLRSFFAVRSADAMLAAGSATAGLAGYKAVKKISKGEGLALSEMALADYYSGEGGKPLEAKALYKEVAKSGSRGAGEAYIRLAIVLEKLKEYGEAMKTLDEISPEKKLFTRREMAGFLRSRIAFNWIKDLYSKKKWLDTAKVNFRYGDWITFGKRAGNSLRAGEALMRLGLTPDAIRALNNAVNIGSKKIKTKAVLLLTRLYLDQRDGHAASAVLEDLRSSSPEAARLPKWSAYYIEAQYLKGNFKEVIRLSRGKKEGPLVLLRAAAYRGLGMWPEAGKSYAKARALFRKNKDKKRLLEAETGYADSQFIARGFTEAIDAYNAAEAMSANGPAVTESWLRYRLSLSYSGAGMREKAVNALKNLKHSDRSYGAWAEALQLAQRGGS